MKCARTYKVLQLTIDDIYNYSVKMKRDGSEMLIVEEKALCDMLYTMVPYEKKSILDPALNAPDDIARVASIYIPYNAAMRQIFIQNVKENVTEHSNYNGNEVKSAEEKITSEEKIRKQFLDGPDNNDYYLFDLLYIDMNSHLNQRISDNWKDLLYEGITLCFNQKQVKFVLFERSASQQRRNILVMINDELFNNNLKDRIRCGLNDTDISKFKVITSKYAAYRALLLTSGICIDNSVPDYASKSFKNNTLVDSDSVVVISDFTMKHWAELCETFYNNKSDYSLKVQCDTALPNGDKEKLVYKSNHDLQLESEKLFDGEGLISPTASKIISERLADKNEKPRYSSSFQVRMPFVKGVLHKVDFHNFFKEIFNTDPSKLTITDEFGKTHKLSDVHFILTVSMFKMFKNYKNINNNKKDGWLTYWEAFKTHEHCLIISNTDEIFNESTTSTITNYQFLSTLEEKDNARRLGIVSPSVNALYSAINSTDSLAVSTVLRERNLADDIEEEVEDKQKPDVNNEKAFITDAMLISRCPAIINTSPFRNNIKNDILAKDFSYGHLIEPGVMRFLSGDLLQLLCLIACIKIAYIKQDNLRNEESVIELECITNNDKWQETKNKLDKIIKEINEASYSNCNNEKYIYYYAPGQTELDAIIDRNPHLTRNEHVYGKPLNVSDDSYRQKYLAHLKGTVMIQVDSNCALQRLGGADFDGDIARLFFDPAYIKAAESCRKTRPLVITPFNHQNDDVPYTDKEKVALIKRASGSKVGLYSNYAFYTSLYAYGSRIKQKSDINANSNLVLLSCAIGLEIDSVKTGIKPKLDRKDLVFFEEFPGMNKNKRDNQAALSYFLDYKDAVKKEDASAHTFFQLPKLKSEYGVLSLVENLPYIFSPYRLNVPKDYIAEEWAEYCRRILFDREEVIINDGTVNSQNPNEESETEDVIKSKEDTKKNGSTKNNKTQYMFKPFIDKYISNIPKIHRLYSLLPKPKIEDASLGKLFFDAYCALRAHTFISTRIGNTETNKKLDTLRRLLIQRYGNYSGTKLTEELQKINNVFGDEEEILDKLCSIVPWKNLPFAEMRKSRFIALAKKNRIDLNDTLINSFDKICCSFSDLDSDSSELAKILLTNNKVHIDISRDLLLFENNVKNLIENDVIKLNKENIVSILAQCLHSLNYSFNLLSLKSCLDDNEDITKDKLEKLCKTYSVFLPCSCTFTDDTVNKTGTLIIDKFFELYTDSKERITALKYALAEELPVSQRIIKCVLNSLYDCDEDNDQHIIERIYRDSFDNDGKINSKSKLKILCGNVEALWKKLQINDASESKYYERLQDVANDIYREPEFNWLNKHDSQARKDHLKNNLIESGNELNEILLDILCDSKNYQLLPAFLDYCRSTVDTYRKRQNSIKFDQRASYLIRNYIETDDLDITSSAINILKLYVKKIKDKFINSEYPRQNLSQLKAGIVPVKTISEYIKFIQKWRLNPENDNISVQNNWLIIDKQAISLSSALLYCIIRTIITPHYRVDQNTDKSELLFYDYGDLKLDDMAECMLSICYPISQSNEPDDKAKITSSLYSLLKYSYLLSENKTNTSKKLMQENQIPSDSVESIDQIPSDSVESIEQFIISYLRRPLYKELKSYEKDIKEVKSFKPDMSCGFIDGCQCASIRFKKCGQNKLGKKSVTITVTPYSDKNRNEIPSVETFEKILESNIKYEKSGFENGEDCKVSLGISTDSEEFKQLKYKESVLNLYSIPYKVEYQSSDGIWHEIAKGIISRLCLPDNIHYGDLEAEFKPVISTINIAPLLDDEMTNTIVDSTSYTQSVNKVPLKNFIWGFKKYSRNDVKEICND